MHHLVFRCTVYDATVYRTLLDRVVSLGESLPKRAFCNSIITKTIPNDGGNVDSIIHLLRHDNFTKPYSHEHRLVHLLSTAL